jgi:hypothetical protein
MDFISDEFIKNTLRHYDEESKTIFREIEDLTERILKQQNYLSSGAIVEAISYNKTSDWLETCNSFEKDISKICDRCFTIRRDALTETRNRIKALISRQEKMDLVMKAYYLLPDDNGKNALTHLYVHSTSWKEGRSDYIKKYGCSETTLKNHYRKGIKDIRKQIVLLGS